MARHLAGFHLCRRRGQSAAPSERDGLVSCGDIGYLDAEGYLYLNDRRSDIVNSGGVNIYSTEIEACLLSLDGVRDCAVFGVPDDEYGEVVAAHVELAEGAAAERRAGAPGTSASTSPHTRRRASSSSATRSPREDSGKIFKRRLREPYWSGRERTI